MERLRFCLALNMLLTDEDDDDVEEEDKEEDSLLVVDLFVLNDLMRESFSRSVFLRILFGVVASLLVVDLPQSFKSFDKRVVGVSVSKRAAAESCLRFLFKLLGADLSILRYFGL